RDDRQVYYAGLANQDRRKIGTQQGRQAADLGHTLTCSAVGGREAAPPSLPQHRAHSTTLDGWRAIIEEQGSCSMSLPAWRRIPFFLLLASSVLLACRPEPLARPQ